MIEIFRAGDAVYLNPAMENSLVDIFAGKHGSGPFRVVKVEPIRHDSHSQHCFIEGYPYPISGAWLTHRRIC